jgi:hypothetical protein
MRHELADHTRAQNPPWNDRAHFFRAAAEAMRRILIEHARKYRRIKRGGDRVRVSLSDLTLGLRSFRDDLGPR